MSWFTRIYMGLIGAAVVGAGALSYTGALLPAPNEGSSLSLRDVENRRTHFVRNYSLGK